MLLEVIGDVHTNRPDNRHSDLRPGNLRPACGAQQVRRLPKPAEIDGPGSEFILFSDPFVLANPIARPALKMLFQLCDQDSALMGCLSTPDPPGI